jgi:hypothetical protein
MKKVLVGHVTRVAVLQGLTLFPGLRGDGRGGLPGYEWGTREWNYNEWGLIRVGFDHRFPGGLAPTYERCSQFYFQFCTTTEQVTTGT